MAGTLLENPTIWCRKNYAFYFVPRRSRTSVIAPRLETNVKVDDSTLHKCLSRGNTRAAECQAQLSSQPIVLIYTSIAESRFSTNGAPHERLTHIPKGYIQGKRKRFRLRPSRSWTIRQPAFEASQKQTYQLTSQTCTLMQTHRHSAAFLMFPKQACQT